MITRLSEHVIMLQTASDNWRLKNGGLAQLARAPALHAGGHRFDSDILHRSVDLIIWLVVNLVLGQINKLPYRRINRIKVH